MLTNPRYRQHARRIQAEYRRHNASEEAASLLEQLAHTQQPVLRDAPLPWRAPRQVDLAMGE